MQQQSQSLLMETERTKIVEYSKRLLSDNLTKGTAGNISIINRAKGYIAISPTGMPYNSLKPSDIVIIDLDANIIDGVKKPSSEYYLHILIYKTRPEINAVVHTHSMYCTVMSTINEPLQSIHYVLADCGATTVPIVPYHTYGTKDLATAVVETMGDSRACLLQNHGMLACGTSLESAYGLAATCEWVAELQWKALSIRQPNYLNAEQMHIVMEKFKGYGQKDSQDKGQIEPQGYFS